MQAEYVPAVRHEIGFAGPGRNCKATASHLKNVFNPQYL
jgi:hypothetical protein